MKSSYPTTPDGRYFVVKGRLWRCANPQLNVQTKKRLIKELMQGRRDKGDAMRKGDALARELARQHIDLVKQALGERGPAWWSDGAPDWNRHMVCNSPYAEWFSPLDSDK